MTTRNSQPLRSPRLILIIFNLVVLIFLVLFFVESSLTASSARFTEKVGSEILDKIRKSERTDQQEELMVDLKQALDAHSELAEDKSSEVTISASVLFLISLITTTVLYRKMGNRQ